MTYILMAVILIPFLSFCTITINNFIVDKKQKRKISIKSVFTLIALITIIISAASYITNLGYIRVLMFIPMYLHTLLFFFITYGASEYTKKSRAMKVIILISLISYPLANILLPDNAMYGYDYAIFGLVGNRTATSLCSIVSVIGYFINIISLASQVVLWLVIKKHTK